MQPSPTSDVARNDIPIFSTSDMIPTPQFTPIQVTPQPGTLGAVVSTIAPVIDVLSRGQYASAKFFDSIGDESKSIFDAIADAFGELVDPKQRLSFSDLIKKNAPTWARENQKATAVLGFMLDIALDPTTYLGVGLSKAGLKVGGRTLSELGQGVLKETMEALGKRAVPVAVAQDLSVLGRAVTKEEARKALSVSAEAVRAQGLGVPFVEGLTKKADVKKSLQSLSQQAEDQAKMLGLKFGATNPWIKIKGKINESVANELGLDLAGFDTGRALFRKLTSQEIYETAEKRIANLVDLSPDSFKLFEKSGARLTFGIPFGKTVDIPGTRQLFNVLGVNKLSDKISALKGVEVVRNLGAPFVRRFGLDKAVGVKAAQEFEKAILDIEHAFDSNVDAVVRDTKALFDGVSSERRELIGRTMADIDDKTRLTEESLARIGRNLTQAGADRISQRILAAANLNPREMSIVANLQQSYKDMQLLERHADVLKHSILNYNPRIYDILKDPTEFNLLWRQRGTGLGGKFTPGMERKFRTLAEAEANGYVPVLDAAMLYANRALQSRRALQVKQFNESVGEIFGVPNFNAKSVDKIKELNRALAGQGNAAKIVLDDMRLLGDAVYPAGINETSKYWLQAWDRFNSGFRKMATVAKPSFGARQLIGNTLQAAMILGTKAFKSFDPRAALDASLLFLDRGKPTKNLPEFVNDFFSKFVGDGERGADAVLAQRLALAHITGEERVKDYVAQHSIRTTMGQIVTGRELVDEVRSLGVVRGQDFLGEPFNIQLSKELAYNSNSLKDIGKSFALPEEMRMKVFGKDVVMPLPWARLPRLIEDYGRTMAYISARRMGYAPAEAAKVVNRAYFDYSRGLSHIERSIIRRFLPFYTYQRFAIPLVLKSALTQPGTAATTNKVIMVMDKLLNSENGSDNLSDAEGEIFGKTFVFEQPRLFRGFDKDGKLKFNIFNNMTPLDVLSFIVTDRKGDVDVQRTVEKSMLAMLTPFIKLPVEAVIDKQFFSGRTLAQAARLGDLSQGTLSAVLPDAVKAAMSWEDRHDKLTGKTNSYINPWMAHFMVGVMPALQNFIDVQQADKTPLEKALKIFLGVQSVKLDLKEQRIWQAIADEKDINDLMSNIRKAYRQDSKSNFDSNMADLKELIANIKEANARKRNGEVRGQGLFRPNVVEAAEQVQK